jgi:hypothetical protein
MLAIATYRADRVDCLRERFLLRRAGSRAEELAKNFEQVIQRLDIAVWNDPEYSDARPMLG